MGFKHVIPHLVQRFLNNESPFKIYGHDQTRSFSYISDSVEGTILAMESKKSDGEIYHIGSSEEISIEELIKETGRIMNFKGTYENAPTYPGSVSRRCPDITKAENQLGFKPKVNWKEGLKETVKWYEDFYKTGVESFEKGFEAPAFKSIK
jgi:UDP-glucose 4-epimerase